MRGNKKYEKESKPMMSTILEQWPCFESGEYVSIYDIYMYFKLCILAATHAFHGMIAKI